MQPKHRRAILSAILAAVLYALNSPGAKVLLEQVPPTMMAGLLYLGAGLGMGLLAIGQRLSGKQNKEKPLTRKQLPYVLGMIALDILAPILLMLGLKSTTAANASLLNNFEIVATSLIALFAFKEAISRRLWAAIALVTVASLLLSFDDMSSLSFSPGSLLVLGAAACWGLENNCTRMLSSKDPKQIVVLKGFGSGFGALAIALFLGEQLPAFGYLLLTLLLGFVAYGMSIYLYVYAQRDLGAAKTSTYYAIAPFVGVLLSVVLLGEQLGAVFFLALAVMAAGAWLATTDHPSPSE